MVAVADSSDSHCTGSTPWGKSSASASGPSTYRRSGPMPASDSSSSGSSSSTVAPEWPRMYSTSAAARRKLIGTRMRPEPDTPKNDVSSRAELCDTMATRSPGPMPRRSNPAAWALARSARSANVSGSHGSAGWSGSSTTATRSGYVKAARSRNWRTLNWTCMALPLLPFRVTNLRTPGDRPRSDDRCADPQVGPPR